MKHLFTMLLALVATTASAQDFMVDGICYNILSEDDMTGEVTESPYGYAGDVVIPAEVTYDGGTYSVTAIGERAFYECDDLVSVDMPSVMTIGDRAFLYCSALTSVSMPSVTTIGESAFWDCSALTSVEMPSVTTIGDGAFYYCEALTSVHIPASCTSIAGNPFQRCESLEEIVVDENNPNYSSMDGVLYDKYMSTLIACPGKKISIDIPSSVTTIGESAFYYCSALTSVSMPVATTIGEFAFPYCSSLTSVSMPEATTIGDQAFYDCSALTSVEMPKATTIGDEAFYDCSALTSVSMPSVTTIGDQAFRYCSALTSVSIPESCTSIVGNPFQECKSLEEIVVDENNPNYSSADGALYDKGKTTLIGWPTAEGDITIPQSVTTIGDGAFHSCGNLTSVSMPEATTIGNSAFRYCSALTSVSMPSVTTIGDLAFYDCRTLASVSMPSVTTIGEYAFQSCWYLTSVSMPSVTTIGNWAFNGSALTSVSMPAVTTIGDWAFEDCSALTSVEIPASVTMIGSGAFDGCNSLTSVYCHWEQPLECDPRFEETVLANATLYVPDGCVDAYRAVKPWSEFANIEEGGYSGIADSPQLGLSVRVIDGAIVVEGGDMAVSAPVVEVYSAGGQCVYRGTDTVIGGLTHGIYVVKVGGTVQKVAL